ncbi:hypothetical protein [uncultured Tateyamaria sp.]|uniref:hypothetical protein n=1 Tax=uncultured Tateyamaria sp. TaxID=455651 RepID=UPI00260B9CBD|nr:hypothetical protein [uncultured Tateyamaria sp.]
MEQILAYYVGITTLLLFLFVFLTIFLLRKDKCFTLALLFAEFAGYVAIASFGQGTLVRLSVTILGLDASSVFETGAETDLSMATLTIAICGSLSIASMVVRIFSR